MNNKKHKISRFTCYEKAVLFSSSLQAVLFSLLTYAEIKAFHWLTYAEIKVFLLKSAKYKRTTRKEPLFRNML